MFRKTPGKKINTSIDGVEVPISSTEDKMLTDEPGIPELENSSLIA